MMLKERIMSVKQIGEDMMRIPLSIFFRGRKYIGEITGPIKRKGHLFACRIPGAADLVIEPVAQKPAGGYLWAARGVHELNNYVAYIGKQVEKYLGIKPAREGAHQDSL